MLLLIVVEALLSAVEAASSNGTLLLTGIDSLSNEDDKGLDDVVMTILLDDNDR